MNPDVTAFDAIRVGQMMLPNRIVMAPMTRSRAAGPGLATEPMARYYAQRASFTPQADGSTPNCCTPARRLAQGGPFNVPHRETFYGGGADGYVDYPFLPESDSA